MKLIPAIDLKDGKCVRLLQGDFERSTEYSSDPAAVCRQFSALSVEDLHIVDLDGALTGNPGNRQWVTRMAAESGLTIQLGGGIRSEENVSTWLDSGVSRVVIGSVAIQEPDKVKGWIRRFGAAAIVLALDIRLDDDGEPRLTTNGWTQTISQTLWQCLDIYKDAGAQHVLCTDVSRDGALSGPNCELYADILSCYPDLQLQASGGIRNLADLRKLRALGVPAAISGRALLDGAITTAEVAAFRQDA